jgi:hypothetical protein
MGSKRYRRDTGNKRNRKKVTQAARVKRSK